jgi:hypothetical protein
MSNLAPVPDVPARLDLDVPVARSGLTIPLVRVVPADGDPYEIQCYNPDLLLFEETAAKHRWRGPADAPFRWLTFLAWAASRRTGRIAADVTWESFAATTLEISDARPAAPPTDPTRPVPGPG